MPPDHGCRIEDFHRAQHLGRQAIEPCKHKAVDIAEDRSFRRSTTQNIELMAKDKNFGVQRSPGPKQAGQICTRSTYRDRPSVRLSPDSLALVSALGLR